MLIRNRIIAALASLWIALLFLTFSTQGVLASDSFKITIVCNCGDTPISGMKWSIFRIGSFDSGAFRLADELSGIEVDLGNGSEEEISSAAKTFESLMLEKALPAQAAAVSDNDGNAVLSLSSAGTYLAIAESVYDENSSYSASPFIFNVIEGNEESTLIPKISCTSPLPDKRTYIVRKIWEDSNDLHNKRTVSITADLFRNGELTETVTLSQENNWEYIWTDNDPRAEWRVAERNIPLDYTVIIGYNSTQFVIKNTFSNGSGHTADSEDTTVTTTTTAAEKGDSDSSLPQTGQLWWPVFPLSAGGMLLIIVGMLVSSKRKDNEK